MLQKHAMVSSDHSVLGRKRVVTLTIRFAAVTSVLIILAVGTCGNKYVAGNSYARPVVSLAAARDATDPNFIGGDGDPGSPVTGQYIVEIADGLSDNPDNLTTDPSGGYPTSTPSSSSSSTLNRATSTATATPVAATPVDIDDGSWTNPADPVQYPPAVTLATNLCAQYGATLVDTYDVTGSFAATMTETQARTMSHDPNVLYVFPDFDGDPATTQVTPSYDSYGNDEWGLDRIDQRSWATRSGTFTYQNVGTGINVYMVDSGIRVSDPEFQGRAQLDYSAVRGESPSDTYWGHGTQTSSVVGGQLCGAAKNTKLHAVKVIDKHGKWYMSGFLSATNWILKHGKKPAVVNCSLEMRKRGSSWFGLDPGTGPIERAVKRLLGAGFCVVDAAANHNTDFNNYVPGDVWEAVSAGASDKYDERASFSNYGTRLDIFAPGQDVEVSYWSLVNGTYYYSYGTSSGTSFSAPYTTGVLAQYLQTHVITPANIKAWLRSNATLGVLAPSTLPGSTPNRLLFTSQ